MEFYPQCGRVIVEMSGDMGSPAEQRVPPVPFNVFSEPEEVGAPLRRQLGSFNLSGTRRKRTLDRYD